MFDGAVVFSQKKASSSFLLTNLWLECGKDYAILLTDKSNVVYDKLYARGSGCVNGVN